MVILAADDEPMALDALVRTIRKVEPEATVHGFKEPARVLDYARILRADVAFLDIEMRGESGLELAKKLKEIGRNTNIVFVTGHAEYAVDAFGMFASGYIIKPAVEEDIKRAMEHLRSPVKPKRRNGVSVQTFGNFEVYLNGFPLRFARSKSKELFAYLIHKKGTGCTVRELAAILFEEKEYNLSIQRQMQTIISSMLKTLRDAGCRGIVKRSYNNISVDVSQIDCDYYRFLKWDPEAVNSYTGEYMANYSWGEFTIGYLDSQVTDKVIDKEAD